MENPIVDLCPRCKKPVNKSVENAETISPDIVYRPIDNKESLLVSTFKIPFYCDLCGGMYFPYKPTLDRVFIWPDPVPEKSSGGIFIPEAFREETFGFGTILAAGRGYYDQSKRRFISMELKVGDRVCYDKDVPWKVSLRNTFGLYYDVAYMGEKDVKGILEE